MSVDRLAPARRPPGPPALYQRWSELLFLHWQVDPAELRALLPPRLELDTWGGQALVGLVPFTMSRIRPRWAPAVPWLSAFHETNLRTYVLLDGEPGVWFFSLEAARLPGVLIGRALWGLGYRWARMRLEIDGARRRYRSARRWPGPTPALVDIEGELEAAPAPAAPGTLAHFLVERYVLYTQARGRLWRGRVHHAPYLVQPARLLRCEESLLAAAGLTRGTELGPLFSPGVDVEVFGVEEAQPAS